MSYSTTLKIELVDYFLNGSTNNVYVTHDVSQTKDFKGDFILTPGKSIPQISHSGNIFLNLLFVLLM